MIAPGRPPGEKLCNPAEQDAGREINQIVLLGGESGIADQQNPDRESDKKNSPASAARQLEGDACTIGGDGHVHRREGIQRQIDAG